MAFHRSLVNWCCESRRQEDSETWTTTGSKICTGFSSCVNNKVHSRSYNLSNNQSTRDKNKKAKRTCSTKVNAQRDNDLSYFVRAKEQFEKNNEDSSQQEKTQKLRKKSTVVNVISTACTGQVLATNGGETVFGFEHFAEPEDVLTDYINAYIYKRSRLEKVDKKKISDWIIELQNVNKDTSADSNEPRRENTFCGDKLGTKILKLGKRSPMTKFTAQRTTATSNFVFELGSLDATNLQNDKSHEVISTIEGIKGRRTAFNAQENTRDSTNDTKAYLSKSQKSISLLPKLSSAKLQQADGIDNSRAKSYSVVKTVLPNINRWKNLSEGKKKTRISSGNRNKLSPRVDRNTDAVGRSDWEILKQRRNLTHGKDCDNSWQRKKLSDTLEKISKKICKEEHSYLKSKTDNYCDEVTTLGRDDNRQKKCTSTLSKVFDNGLKNVTTASRSDKNNDEDGVSELKKECKIEKYLDEHSRTLVKELSDNGEEEEIIYRNSKVVADILARLDIHDVGFHIDAKKEEKSVNAATSARRYENSRQILAVPEKLNATNDCENVVKTEGKPLKILATANCGQNVSESRGVESPGYESDLLKNKNKSLSGDKRSYGTSQTDKMIVNKNKSAFIEIGLKGLEDRIPKHLGTQILKSNYLRKDLSLKPANFCQTRINFNDPLNSCLNLTLSIGNSGSETSSQRDKLFRQKMQRIMRSSMKDEVKPAKIITKNFNVDDKNYKKLRKIINEKFAGRKEKINYAETRHSFVEKFLDVQTEILMNPRLRAVLPGLIDGIKNLVEIRTR